MNPKARRTSKEKWQQIFLYDKKEKRKKKNKIHKLSHGISATNCITYLEFERWTKDDANNLCREWKISENNLLYL